MRRRGLGRDPGRVSHVGISSGLIGEGGQTRNGPSGRCKSHIMETTGSEAGTWPAGGQVRRLARSAVVAAGVSGHHASQTSCPPPIRSYMSGDCPSERCSWWSLVSPERRLLEEYWSQVIKSFGITGCLMLGVYKETIEITSTRYSHAGDSPHQCLGEPEIKPSFPQPLCSP